MLRIFSFEFIFFFGWCHISPFIMHDISYVIFHFLAGCPFRLHKSAASIFDRKPIDIFDVVTRVWENVIPIKMTQKYTEAIKMAIW